MFYIQIILAQYCVLWVKLMTAFEMTMFLTLLGLFPIVFFQGAGVQTIFIKMY